MKIYTGNTYSGANGDFTAVRYKRNGLWIGGVWDRQTGKREYGHECKSAYAAAGMAESMAEKAAGDGSAMALSA